MKTLRKGKSLKSKLDRTHPSDNPQKVPKRQSNFINGFQI